MSKFSARFLLIVFPAAFLLQVSCDKGVEPPQPPKNPREYIWTIDTIYDPGQQTFATGIWGSSSSDVYVTFAGGALMLNKLYHFDGSNWSQLNLSAFGSSEVGFNLQTITGFASNDVWVGGGRLFRNPNAPPNYFDSTLIIHFDGLSWKEAFIGDKQSTVTTTGGSSLTDVWFGAFNGAVYHFNGFIINKDTIPKYIISNAYPYFSFTSIAGNDPNNIYLLLTAFSTNESFIFKHQNNSWSIFDSSYVYRRSFWMSPSGKLYLTGYSLYQLDGTAWTTILDDSHAVLVIHGSSDTNIFAAGLQGKMYHYNGSDWFQYKNLENPNMPFYGVWTDGKEVFVISNDGFKSYIYHGK